MFSLTLGFFGFTFVAGISGMAYGLISFRKELHDTLVGCVWSKLGPGNRRVQTDV